MTLVFYYWSPLSAATAVADVLSSLNFDVEL